MPMAGAPPAPPPQLAGGGTGPAATHGPMAGSAAQGISKVKVALEALQAALPMLPMGGELHTDVTKALSQLGKHVQQGQGGDVVQQLLEMIRNSKTQGAPAMPGAPPPGGAAPPGMPPPGAMPPPPMMGA